jgi:hypothetical protein
MKTGVALKLVVVVVMFKLALVAVGLIVLGIVTLAKKRV